MKRFSAADGPETMAYGLKMVKKPNPVYLRRQAFDFEVETAEGVMRGKAGDYLAHDPISGHVWCVTESYVDQHYELVAMPLASSS